MELFSESYWVSAALALGAEEIQPWSRAEEKLAEGISPVPRRDAADLRRRIQGGDDPLGTGLSALRSNRNRRKLGATYTPLAIVQAMVQGAAQVCTPYRVVDPGTGSGRFAVCAGRAFPQARVVAIEVDPVAALLARAHLAAAGLAGRAEVHLADFRGFPLSPVDGPTLFIGNPPYVRHHALDARWKKWFVRAAAGLQLRASQLAGLHAHFFLATAVNAREGDTGCFITAAEWLDVNYGALVRNLLLGPLGGLSIVILDPRLAAFPDAQTTAAISTFRVGGRPKAIRFVQAKSAREILDPERGSLISRRRLQESSRWSSVQGRRSRPLPGYIQLGELCRVHRGQVTGANRVWIAGPHSHDLPESVLFPAITRARELFNAYPVLSTTERLRAVIDLPKELDHLDAHDRRCVLRFLVYAQAQGADTGYIARARTPWWRVGLREPAPILATYMARRPPAFVRNEVGARHLNIAHGLYPREPLAEDVLQGLAAYLSEATSLTEGRTYAGGLVKFEPREMERLYIPDTPTLKDYAAHTATAVV